MRRALAVAGAALLVLCTRSARAEEPPAVKSVPQPESGYTYVEPQYYPSFAWILTQLVPSPEVSFGRVRHIDGAGQVQDVSTSAFGLRWQVTPVLWSWGVNRRVTRWRYFVVDPLARNAGSIELNGSLEYLWGDVHRFLARPGVRATFPLLQRGEYLSMSIGTSTYQYDNTFRVAYDAGLHVLYGILGAQLTVAPGHAPMRTLATLTLRYF